eukprot:Hpha_TRINITY_DN1194_c0_g1::TRINITY_DN1194_c0_g1_i1::g.113069::m.113069
MASEEEGEAAADEKKKKLKLLNIINYTVNAVLWGLTLAVTIKLVSDWVNSGKNPKVGFDSQTVNEIFPPWMIFQYSVGDCNVSVDSCYIIPADRGLQSITDCSEMLTEVNSVTGWPNTLLLNQTLAKERGWKLTSTLDSVSIVLKTDGADMGDCMQTPESRAYVQSSAGLMLWLVPISTMNAVNMLELDKVPPRNQVGPFFSVGLGNVASIAFAREEVKQMNGTVESTVGFSVTQHPMMKPGSGMEIYFEITARSFTVPRTVHQQGTQLWELLGTIFGWVGVFSGLCLSALYAHVHDLLRTRALNSDGEGGDKGNPELLAQLEDLTRRVKELESVGTTRSFASPHSHTPRQGPRKSATPAASDHEQPLLPDQSTDESSLGRQGLLGLSNGGRLQPKNVRPHQRRGSAQGLPTFRRASLESANLGGLAPSPNISGQNALRV